MTTGSWKRSSRTPGQLIDGPALVNSAINANSDISKEVTLLNQQGSAVKLGNVITVPINQSLVYVQPLYIQAQANPVPRLDDVIVVYNGQAVHGGTLDSAFCQLPFGQSFCTLPDGNVPPPSQQANNNTGVSTTGPTTTPSTTPAGGSTGPTTTTPPSSAPPANATIGQLLNDAQTHFTNAENALKSGDLATYQKEIGAAQSAVQQAQKLAAAGTPASSVPASTTPGPPSTTPPASTSPPASAPATTAPASPASSALGSPGSAGPSP